MSLERKIIHPPVNRVHFFSWMMAARWLACLLIPTIGLFTTEWIHRGSLEGFFAGPLSAHFKSFMLGWAFLAFIYIAVSRLSGLHCLGTLLVGIFGNIPAVITFYKLQMRGEPFLPWDVSQVSEVTKVVGQANLQIQPSMIWTMVIFVGLFAATFFLKEPRRRTQPRGFLVRMITGASAVVLLLGLVFGIYLRPAMTAFFDIAPDMWLQDRYYRTHGVITGFLSNLQALDISAPDGYNHDAVQNLAQRTIEADADKPLFENSYAANTKNPEKQPNIIYVMAEAFYDVSELEGIVFDEQIAPNLHKLKETGAVGRSYSPSFGGGTCDVEFEALTGYSVEHLPVGSKPYQQHVTRPMAALPHLLKSQGYNTVAIHGYYRKFWNRDKAYPNLGIDRFVAAEDFVNPEKKRSYYWKSGLISDAEMGRRIIEEYEARDKDKPLFIHAVTMQNHSSYHAGNYPEEELVNVVQAPEGLSQETISQLRDFATGIQQTDEMLGTLIDYFSKVDEPTILVFWGDHYNTVGKGYELYEKTGWIAPGDKQSPHLHGTPLAIWSNYYHEPVDLGTIASYQISPMVMDLYGLEKPLFFDFLLQELSAYRARTRGVTVNPDGSFSSEMTAEQQQWFDEHWMLQYDQMFGHNYLNKS